MNEEEIRSRILICEIKERDYREVGNTKTAERYNQEKYKWEELLDKIDPKNYEKLKLYKQGYIRLDEENQQLKEQLEKYQIQNFNLREDKIIKKMSFPNEEIKDKSLLELYSMPSYEDLKEQLKQKEDIINKAREYIYEHARIDDEYPAYIEMLLEEKNELLEILDRKE